jgi:hypothetical protein
VSYSGACASLQDQGRFKAVLESEAPVSVVSFAPWPFQGFEARLLVTLTIGELRANLSNALNVARQDWLVMCAYLSVDTIEVQGGGGLIPEVPTGTAVSLASLAILALVGLMLLRQLK